MDVIKYPELREALGKLDALWDNRRMAGVHKQDVEDILMDTFYKAVGKDIVIIRSDDWCVVYVDGIDEHQGHSVDIRGLIDYLPIRTMTHMWVTDKYDKQILQKLGSFPSTLEEYLKDKSELE